MTYKYNVPMHENITAQQQQEIMQGEKLASLQNDARQFWNKLIEHAKYGKCTCHLVNGCEIHILNACVTGRNLSDEYETSLRILQEYKK